MPGMLIPYPMWPDSQAKRKVAIKSRNTRFVSREHPQLLATPWQVLGDTKQDRTQLCSHSSSSKAQYTERSDGSSLVPACSQ